MVLNHLGRPARLGKKEARVVPGALKLSKYLTPSLPPAPPRRDWTLALGRIGQMLNDVEGDCTCATPGHMIQVFTSANGRQVDIPDEVIDAMYRRISGYDGTPETDQGAFVVDALADWKKNGLQDSTGRVHKILGSADVSLGNREHFKQAIDCFGGVYLGVSLPLSAQDQANWTLALGDGDSGRGSWGGHATSAHHYDENGLWVVTWGILQRLSWPWLDVYCDEAHAVVTEDWADSDGAPSGFDKATLLADLTAVG